MALNIKDPAIHALARELAQTTGRRQSSGGCQPALSRWEREREAPPSMPKEIA
jgi:hypothetical protein